MQCDKKKEIKRVINWMLKIFYYQNIITLVLIFFIYNYSKVACHENLQFQTHYLQPTRSLYGILGLNNSNYSLMHVPKKSKVWCFT